MSTNDRPETLTPAELREQSESWRRAALAWQAWAAGILAVNGAQLKGGERGDEAARAKIEALTRRGRTKPSLALEAAALAYAGAVASRRNEEASLIAAHRARTGHRRGALDTLEAEERLGSHDAAVERARGAMGRAAVALWKAERRRSAGGGRAKP